MSPLVFGSMRMSEDKGDEHYWAKLLCQAYYAGIDTIHSSSEYDSFPLLQKVLKEVSLIDSTIVFKHIVKLAEPHFSDYEYSSNRLKEKVSNYLSIFEIDKLEAIQWMWRSNLSDPQRIDSFIKQQEQMRHDIEDLKQSGLVCNALCFPYSVGFMEKALESNIFDGFCIYRNPQELEYDRILTDCDDGTVVSIRPFSADKALIESEGVIKLLEYNFLEPAIKSTILSISSVYQLNEIKGYLNAKKNT